MLIIGTNVPTRISGILQLWLLELSSNVFIGNVNKIIEKKIINFIEKYLSSDVDLIIVRSNNSIQGFSFEYPFNINQKIININGISLVQKIINT